MKELSDEQKEIAKFVIKEHSLSARENQADLNGMFETKIQKRFEEVMTNVSKKGLSFESITRARRKIQSKYPELTNKKIVSFRDKKQKEFIAYSRKV